MSKPKFVRQLFWMLIRSYSFLRGKPETSRWATARTMKNSLTSDNHQITLCKQNSSAPSSSFLRKHRLRRVLLSVCSIRRLKLTATATCLAEEKSKREMFLAVVLGDERQVKIECVKERKTFHAASIFSISIEFNVFSFYIHILSSCYSIHFYAMLAPLHSACLLLRRKRIMRCISGGRWGGGCTSCSVSGKSSPNVWHQTLFVFFSYCWWENKSCHFILEQFEIETNRKKNFGMMLVEVEGTITKDLRSFKLAHGRLEHSKLSFQYSTRVGSQNLKSPRPLCVMEYKLVWNENWNVFSLRLSLFHLVVLFKRCCLVRQSVRRNYSKATFSLSGSIEWFLP